MFVAEKSRLGFVRRAHSLNTCGLNQVPRASHAIRIALSIAVERKRKWNIGSSLDSARRTDLCDLSVVFIRRTSRKEICRCAIAIVECGRRNAFTRCHFSYFLTLLAARVKIYLWLAVRLVELFVTSMFVCDTHIVFWNIKKTCIMFVKKYNSLVMHFAYLPH